ncbi:hypothetical protein [Salinivibrio sp. ES.052]|nr:hypothetical protein [Salinivibrio sp. ES.052]SIN98369.1 hypothetical protein SAMN05444724_1513 [Salinivibrio sp. ES.052]
MTKPTFDMDAALQALREGKDLTGKDDILTLPTLFPKSLNLSL